MVGFAVDTHLLRELGDLLVGRDSTAVLELIKNAYDADARSVTLRASALDDPEHAELVVSDDGNGMSLERFTRAFLRIAGREKESGARVSPRYQRAYTGQKGIGRLASQKLAKRLQVESHPRASGNARPPEGVRADIDWQVIDEQDTLDDLAHGLNVDAIPSTPEAAHGTTLRLSALKREWSPAEVAQFVLEVSQTQPPQYLLGDPPRFKRREPALFDRPHLRDAKSSDPGFDLHLEGDFSPGDDLWEIAAGHFDWCVEISVADGIAQYSVVPSFATAERSRFALPRSFKGEVNASLRFHARFFVLENASTRRGPLKDFTRSRSGVRVYLEGFRVLPYGEWGDDWLELDREYRSGARFYDLNVESLDQETLEKDSKEGLSALANSAYYGAVFLTNAGAADLESVINREGFVPSPMFNDIRSIVQTGARLSVRVRRAILLQNRLAAAIPDPGGPSRMPNPATFQEPSQPAVSPVPSPSPAPSFALLSPQTFTAESRAAIDRAAAQVASATTPNEVAAAATDLKEGFIAARANLDALGAIQPELRILAGVGLQLGAFVHDINGMLGSTRAIRRLLDRALDEEPDPKRRRELRVILNASEELAHVLARQSSYLTDVLSLDPRRRRSRVSARASAESVLQFLETRIKRKGLSVILDVGRELRSPPIFPAEMSVLLTNLLTNAVKNAAPNGTIWLSGRQLENRGLEIAISNDGESVDLAESERWFQPFESTTVEVDEILGQGLGLGLPIVRSIAADYNGAAWFSEPVVGASTTVRVQLRERG